MIGEAAKQAGLVPGQDFGVFVHLDLPFDAAKGKYDLGAQAMPAPDLVIKLTLAVNC